MAYAVDNKMTSADLKIMQGWSLERKVRVTQLRIQEALLQWDGNAIVNFSGGKDSSVLLDLARRVEPSIKAVFVNTGLEYPEVVDFVNTFDNVDIIEPRLCGDKCIGDKCKTKCYGRIVKEVGWNFPSKDVALTIEYARKGSKWALDKLNGVSKDGTPSKYRQRYRKWGYLMDAPFLISNKCCGLLKEELLDRYHRKSGRIITLETPIIKKRRRKKNGIKVTEKVEVYKEFQPSLPIVATMASESKRRRDAWLRTGCNAFDIKRPISKVMSFWTEQDILRYIKLLNLPIASCYGDIVQGMDGILRTTGESRTGCYLCPVGCHLDKENKYIRLQQYHPELWEYGVEIGITDVLDYIGVNYKVPRKNKKLF